jgi:putative transposase
MQYLSIRYTQRLAEEGAITSVGSRDDSYDNARAESFHSLDNAELIRNQGRRRGVDDVEFGGRAAVPTCWRFVSVSG